MKKLAMVQQLFDQDQDQIYPSSDGKPMADNTWQYRWIVPDGQRFLGFVELEAQLLDRLQEMGIKLDEL